VALLISEAPAAAPADHPRPGLGHITGLDGLRGLAVAGVVTFHLGWIRGGYLGVDAFFVLSGFLITSLLLVEHRTHGRISLRQFWGRRARRLLPAMLVMVAVVLVWAMAADPGQLASIRGDAVATLLYVANWHEIATSADY
jgi:peptidoglycan/LPS O-acetylase OafA/YrhL